MHSSTMLEKPRRKAFKRKAMGGVKQTSRARRICTVWICGFKVIRGLRKAIGEERQEYVTYPRYVMVQCWHFVIIVGFLLLASGMIWQLIGENKQLRVDFISVGINNETISYIQYLDIQQVFFKLPVSPLSISMHIREFFARLWILQVTFSSQ